MKNVVYVGIVNRNVTIETDALWTVQKIQQFRGK